MHALSHIHTRSAALLPLRVLSYLYKSSFARPLSYTCWIGSVLPSRFSLPGRGGRFETFHHFYERDQKSTFHVLDCVSLYPAMSCEQYPVGEYEIETNLEKLRKIKFDHASKHHYYSGKKVIGIGHVLLLTPFDLEFPLFGIKTKEGYNYGNCTACIKNRSAKKCKHGVTKRAILVTACWNELNYAVSIGYKIEHIYEAYLYSKEEPIFQKFIQLLSREKIRFTNWNGNIQDYLNDVNKKMNFPPSLQLTPSELTPNKIKRSYAKQDLVMIFGKLSQQNMRTKPIVIQSQRELQNVDLNAIDDVFSLEKACILIARNESKHSRHNRKANSILYAYVLAYSRIYMHKIMRNLLQNSAQIFQISNDCLYFTLPHNTQLNCVINMGSAFGDFRDEYPEFSVSSFVSFGTKSCAILLKNNTTGEMKQIVKARGFTLSNITSQKLINQIDFKSFFMESMENNSKTLKIPQIRQRKKIETLHVEFVLLLFQFSNTVKNSRVIFSDGRTVPFGYV